MTKIKRSTRVMSFRPVVSFETSSKGPGCRCMDRRKANIAMSQYPRRISIRMAKNERIRRILSPNKLRIAWPPSNMPVGTKLSMVISTPTQPAKATGCNKIAFPEVPLGGNSISTSINSVDVGSKGAPGSMVTM